MGKTQIHIGKPIPQIHTGKGVPQTVALVEVRGQRSEVRGPKTPASSIGAGILSLRQGLTPTFQAKIRTRFRAKIPHEKEGFLGQGLILMAQIPLQNLATRITR